MTYIYLDDPMWCLDNTLTWHLEGRANKNYIHIQAQTITYLITSYTKNVSCVENISTNAFIQYNLKHIMTWTSLHHWYIKIPFSRKQYLRVCLNIRLLFTVGSGLQRTGSLWGGATNISERESGCQYHLVSQMPSGGDFLISTMTMLVF